MYLQACLIGKKTRKLRRCCTKGSVGPLACHNKIVRPNYLANLKTAIGEDNWRLILEDALINLRLCLLHIFRCVGLTSRCTINKAMQSTTTILVESGVSLHVANKN
jgi:hypothetical protein